MTDSGDCLEPSVNFIRKNEIEFDGVMDISKCRTLRAMTELYCMFKTIAPGYVLLRATVTCYMAIPRSQCGCDRL